VLLLLQHVAIMSTCS